MHFQYDEKEINYLSTKDKKMQYIINKIGIIERAYDDNLFEAVLHHIIGQQISTFAQTTIWNRIKTKLINITPETILNINDDELQSCGLTYRKVDYIKDFAKKINSGIFNLNEINNMEDEEAISYLSSLKGIGRWTAEMILLFCLQRKNIFSYNDLAIQRGLKMIYHHKKITKDLFEKYRRRFSPYCSVASLYIWYVSGNRCKDIKLDKNGFVIYK